MKGLNKAFLIGEIVGTPEETREGAAFDMRVPFDRNEVTLMRVTVAGYERASTVISYLRDGSSVLVEGKLRITETDDGASVVVVSHRIESLSNKATPP